ncbi:DUF4269 domain-containing protein [Guptibacillus spartinae]|uniref:DUF4269 domain-containing protein n=1 Tax=Guptibacillus spartinae TaxID=3025679 RepID=UPI002362CAAC|nr:DUF4269 domain-containing protein [Pseudalkalibacillus spartinae]
MIMDKFLLYWENNLFKPMRIGSDKQKQAFKAIEELGILNELEPYHPTLCGTIPLGVDVEGSDLDMIMEVMNLDEFEHKLKALYGNKQNFKMKRTTIRDKEVVKAKFVFNDFEFELLGQNEPVHHQNAYLHMMIEFQLLQMFPDLQPKVLALRKQGYKTEPAFCKILEITGDSYSGLIHYGRKMKWDQK